MLVKPPAQVQCSYVLLNRVGYRRCYEDRQAEAERTLDTHDAQWRLKTEKVYIQ